MREGNKSGREKDGLPPRSRSSPLPESVIHNPGERGIEERGATDHNEIRGVNSECETKASSLRVLQVMEDSPSIYSPLSPEREREKGGHSGKIVY